MNTNKHLLGELIKKFVVTTDIYAKNKWKKIINNNNPIKLKDGYYDTKNKNTIFGTRINSKILSRLPPGKNQIQNSTY